MKDGEERETAISRLLRAEKEARERVSQAEEDAEQNVSRARKEADERIEDAKREARQEADGIVEEARRDQPTRGRNGAPDVDSLKQRAHENMDEASDRLCRRVAGLDDEP